MIQIWDRDDERFKTQWGQSDEEMVTKGWRDEDPMRTEECIEDTYRELRR